MTRDPSDFDAVAARFGQSAKIERLPRKLPDRAARLVDSIEFAHDLRPVLDHEYVVKQWLTRNSVSVVYGEANVGKSFWAIDLAHAVHQGHAWAGCKTRPGPVLYVAAEGGDLFNNRLAAVGARFMVLKAPVTMAGRNCDAQALAQAIGHLAETHGPFAMVIFDTLARVMGGADENAAADISALMRGLDLIRSQSGAHVMLIHHSGKDVAKGARGHSSLRAAVDTEIELTKDKETGQRMARATKQRDLPAGSEDLFDLEVVNLGQDQDGETVTSCRIKRRLNQRGLF